MNVLTRGQWSRVGFLLVDDNYEPARVDENGITVQYSENGNSFTSAGDASRIDGAPGWYYVDLQAAEDWETPVIVIAESAGAQQWRDIVPITPRPDAPVKEPEPEPEKPPGSPVFIEPLDRWSLSCANAVKSERVSAGVRLVRVSGSTSPCQLFTVNSLTPATYLYAVDVESSASFVLGVHVIDHESPYGLHARTEVAIDAGRASVRIVLPITRSVPTARVRFWLNGLGLHQWVEFANGQLYAVDDDAAMRSSGASAEGGKL